jgi:hypothetical protein
LCTSGVVSWCNGRDLGRQSQAFQNFFSFSVKQVWLYKSDISGICCADSLSSNWLYIRHPQIIIIVNIMLCIYRKEGGTCTNKNSANTCWPNAEECTLSILVLVWTTSS